MITCPTCGAEAKAGQRFCAECGTKLATSAPSAQRNSPNDSNTVPHRPSPGAAWSGSGRGPASVSAAPDEDGDDFFSRYRPKAAGSGPAESADADDLPSRRTRRRFNPDVWTPTEEINARRAEQAAREARAAQAREEAERERAAAERAASMPTPDLTAERRSNTGQAPYAAAAREPQAPEAPQATGAAGRGDERVRFDANPFAVPAASEPGRAEPPTARFEAPGGAREPQGAQPPAPAPSARPGGDAFDTVLSGGADASDRPIQARDFEHTGIVPLPGPAAPGPSGPSDVDDETRASAAGLFAVHDQDADSTGAAPAEPAREERTRRFDWTAPEAAAPNPFAPGAGSTADAGPGAAGAAAVVGADAAAGADRRAPGRGDQPAGRDGGQDLLGSWFGDETDDGIDESTRRIEPPFGRPGGGSRAAASASAAGAPPASGEQAPNPFVQAPGEAVQAPGEARTTGPIAGGVPTPAPFVPASGGASGPVSGGAPGDTGPAFGGGAPAQGSFAPAGPGDFGAPVDGAGAGSGGGGRGGVTGMIDRLERPDRRRLFVILGAVAASVLLIVSAFIISGAIGRNQAPTADQPTASAPETSAQQETPSEAPETPTGPPAPVTDQNFQAVAFSSQSENVRCSITPEAGVVCQIMQSDFRDPEGMCAQHVRGAVVGLDSHGWTWPCVDENLAVGETLAYDKPITAGEFTCTISYSKGVTCHNAAGDSFTMEFSNGIQTTGKQSTTPNGATSSPTASPTSTP